METKTNRPQLAEANEQAAQSDQQQSASELPQSGQKLNVDNSRLDQLQERLRQTQVTVQKSRNFYAAHIKMLLDILVETTRQERLDLAPHIQGSIHQSNRIARVAEYCVRGWAGDLIEIGCFVGKTTRMLAEVASRYDRKVIAVDPWELGTQNCKGGEYEAFLKSIEPYREYVEIVRVSSQEEKIIELIKSKKLCFAFVDGLHTYDACLVDIQTVSHCLGVIAVDDILWSPECESAFHKGSEVTQRSKIYLPLCREGYLLWN